ncbi:(2Fe-2S)-binding protein [Egibacter rhizosphaerae]|uniref:(2Fe-2S)-binding protein n=1 Tax=Egibacter rhizosphaerae TaxID=1670831 RepID=A0A411YJQ1_9ACTN|nr:(2Fe-2S)-binding protein [Egibacter rhizosphaerae]QBI21426.1 (2Fe-2S)-binding protein [Egibacter rhizosphaerae]
MKLSVNGVEHEIRSSGLHSLLHVLREELSITSAKAGCEQGGCGACTVLIDGEPRRSCLTPVALTDGGSVTTVEGLPSDGELTAVQKAFYAKYGAQCGFCTSGMILAATRLIAEHGSALDDEDIEEAMGGHLCRCTGYVKILDAVKAAARGEQFDLEELQHGLARNGDTPVRTVEGQA